ncbi:methyltransferase [Desulfobotulus sp. H1]|uniref:Methyltransferase n=1 Tax=Desulfobotulus pelophilus TaxID=2823377 RepID=A0ABT3N5L1_9BACT|nr:methyltransferase [Desulfobotulus pelophilus]MCW7752736.1 methyltransferase [Desulfobotulus pelophilus]
MTACTPNSLLKGQLQIYQHKKGYRFSIDPLLLADHAQPRPGEHFVDLGTGCGVLALLLATQTPQIRVTAVELQSDLASLARNNVIANNLQHCIHIIEKDMRLLSQRDLGGPADGVIINPPYFKYHSGRLNPLNEKAAARHEITIDLPGWVLTARKLLKKSGRLYCIFPADRMAELLSTMANNRITPKYLRCVHSLAKNQARLILVEGRMEARHGLTVAPPLVLYKNPGEYSDEALRILWPENQLFFKSPVDSQNKNE